jgi:glutamyl-tRNA synthetase
LIEKVGALDSFTEKDLEGAFMAVMEATGLGFGKVANPARVALSGKNVSPGMFEMIEVLGKPETLKRLENALKFIAG